MYVCMYVYVSQVVAFGAAHLPAKIIPTQIDCLTPTFWEITYGPDKSTP